MEPKFVELTTYSNKPISIRIDDIVAFYSNPYFKEGREAPTTIITLGNNTYEVEEDYEVVKKRILGLEQKDRVYQIPFKEPDKEWIEKSLEEWCRRYYDVMPLNVNSFADVGYQGPTQI